jgi:hypothetical protein
MLSSYEPYRAGASFLLDDASRIRTVIDSDGDSVEFAFLGPVEFTIGMSTELLASFRTKISEAHEQAVQAKAECAESDDL